MILLDMDPECTLFYLVLDIDLDVLSNYSVNGYFVNLEASRNKYTNWYTFYTGLPFWIHG